LSHCAESPRHFYPVSRWAPAPGLSVPALAVVGGLTHPARLALPLILVDGDAFDVDLIDYH
jgi:hypothetical protein